MPVNSDSRMQTYTAPEAIWELFAIDSARYPNFRNAVNTLLKAKMPDKKLFFKPREEERLGGGCGSRSRSYYSEAQLVQLHNAVLIHGIFGMPKQVMKFFDSRAVAERKKLATWVQELLVNRQSVVGIGLLPPELRDFVELLGSDVDLYEEKLPNPFMELPQLALDGRDSLLSAMTTQLSVLSVDESMMIHYLNNNIEAAYQAAQQLPDSPETLIGRYKSLIVNEYQELSAFDEFLDAIR